MDMNQEIRESVRVLSGLEDGNLEIKDCFTIAEELDDVILSLMVRYLRKKYPSNSPNGAGVISRLLEFTSNYPSIISKIKQGDQDPIREWFEETYNYQEFYQTPEEFIRLIVDKIES